MAWLFDEEARNLAVVAGVVGAGFVATYFLSQRALKRTLADLRRELDERVASLTAKVEALSAAPAPAVQIAAPVPAPVAAPPPREEISPDSLLLIAAAVTAFLGKRVRIRSAKMLYAPENFNPWSQQGRAVVQASHNLPRRAH